MIAVATKKEYYQPRNPIESAYYKCVEAHCEEMESNWDVKYQQKYGYWRPYTQNVIFRYLNCGDLHNGFARIKCKKCNNEHLLAFSCKRRAFCPSCHQKRVVEVGEYLKDEVLEPVPHRHWVFSLPKRIRIYFMFDRKLLSKLSQCAWKVMKKYLQASVKNVEDANPSVVVSVHTFGEFMNFNSHLHYDQ